MEWGVGGSRNVQRIASDSPLRVVVVSKLGWGGDTASCIERWCKKDVGFVQVNAVCGWGGGKAGGRAIGRTVPGESARIEERGGDKLHQMKRRQGENVERPLDL